ncbi:hypothetical protein Ga0080574_TMP81 (plasmid) [Salipiger abyssi]|uniref:Uncharacterized protein n=1 Tax=Salipiger abyssi TaxID=1250539 RepID=A0A1P8UM14_9RHOB|nr:hypothetical protein Ga0080574_TMP81 [Salipiger abyssi]
MVGHRASLLVRGSGIWRITARKRGRAPATGLYRRESSGA